MRPQSPFFGGSSRTQRRVVWVNGITVPARRWGRAGIRFGFRLSSSADSAGIQATGPRCLPIRVRQQHCKPVGPARSYAVAGETPTKGMRADNGTVGVGNVLVDLKGFEPLTSSMPFKKNQSLTSIATENKKVTGRRLGLQWTPRSVFLRLWTPFGLRDSTSKTARRVPSRARPQAAEIVVCWRRQHAGFPIRTMPAHAEARWRTYLFRALHDSLTVHITARYSCLGCTPRTGSGGSPRRSRRPRSKL